MIQHVNKINFDEAVRDGRTVLLDFYADWCGPCRMMAPVLEELAATHPEYLFGKVNVDDEEELAARFGVYSIPTLVVLRGGREVARAVGVRPKDAVLSLLNG